MSFSSFSILLRLHCSQNPPKSRVSNEKPFISTAGAQISREIVFNILSLLSCLRDASSFPLCCCNAESQAPSALREELLLLVTFCSDGWCVLNRRGLYEMCNYKVPQQCIYMLQSNVVVSEGAWVILNNYPSYYSLLLWNTKWKVPVFHLYFTAIKLDNIITIAII